MPTDTWIDRQAPPFTRPYLKLMRLDRPIGTWLLLFPCLWSTALAAPAAGSAWPHLGLMILFVIGSVVMRGAGCVVNDLADRHVDGKVARTAGRPIPSGQVSVQAALLFLIGLLLVGLGVLVQLNTWAIAVGAASLMLVFPYPYMKRITYWPQLWLGLTFNWGALVGWTAVTGSLGWPALILYVAGIFWTLGYDTIYAHQDKEDDALIGVKSSALALGGRTVPFLVFSYAACLALIALAGAAAGMGWLFYPLLAVAGGHLVWQVATVDIDHGLNCLTRFKSNRHFGALVLLAIVVGALQGGG
ncbi:4-hydroxybenzoate octaprenyltransferase [Roseospirillum parvum]|nr:4-hydroxybenzoate octaprenyltransferase [Roseospirillum parvum]